MNAEDVARAALNAILVTSIEAKAEYGGMIYLERGRYAATPAQTQGYGNTVDVGVHKENRGCPPHTVPVATYHTHPSYSAGELTSDYNKPSDDDMNISKDYELDAYIGTLDGSFLKYDWKLGKTIRLRGRLKNSSMTLR